MKLNDKGFAISSIMYVVMIMCIILILLSLSILQSRKLILDKQKNEVLDYLYNNEKTNEPNEPLILDGLVPVIYDNASWKIADIEDDWYNYENQEWANAVILNDGVEKKVNETLDIEKDVKAMFVWIPKYEYKINGNEIEINFIDASKVQPSDGYNIHPAFKFGDRNLTGIWVGKFETTGSLDNVTILPNKVSIIPQNINNAFILSSSIKIDGIDSHMAKSVEWGAISYLTQSKYGNKNVGINSCNEYKTGMGNSCTNTYENASASTTGNITGIYDINGGRPEYVMGVLNMEVSSSGFENLNIDDYVDNYTSITNCNGIDCLGDALNETSSFNSGSKTFITQTNPWIIRDSLFGYLNGNGTFTNETFRIILIKS